MNDAVIDRAALSLADTQAQAALAMQRGAYGAAVDLWRDLRLSQPNLPQGYLGGVTALIPLRNYDEAEALLRAGLERFPDHPGLRITRARLFAAKSDWRRAEAEWWSLLGAEANVNQIEVLVGLNQSLSSQGKVDEAERILKIACSANGTSYELHAAQADLAVRSHNWALAESRWRVLHRRFPERSQPVVGLSEALIQQKSYAPAEALLAQALKALPDERGVAEAYARLAVAQSDWENAERRWFYVTERFTNAPLAWHGMAHARLKRGDLDGAEKTASQAVAHFPELPLLLTMHAAVAAHMARWDEAELRWDKLRIKVPNHPEAWIQLAKTRRNKKDHVGAAAILQEAAQRFPKDAIIAQIRAELASTLEDWPTASSLIHGMLQKRPEDRALQQTAFEAAWRASGSKNHPSRERIFKLQSAMPKNVDRDLMLRFESLGSDSEFGMVQRHFGAEPLSFFRWVDISTTNLVRLLQDNMAGVGEPENVQLNLGGDYKVRDITFDFTFHTFVQEAQADRQPFFESQCKRTRFLKREFLDDLEEGTKIFVYKSLTIEPMAEIERLHAAIRGHGPGILMYVRVADELHQSGTIEQPAPGLLIGYISRICDGVSMPNIAHKEWADLCRRALVVTGKYDSESASVLTGRDLMLQFESMGNNCELGWVQRQAGADPLGLLRWTTTTLPALSNAIENEFPGVGDLAKTELLLNHDYRAVDPRYGLTMRTLVRADRAERDIFIDEQCRRMRLLRDFLLADLREGNKIFVHKASQTARSEDVVALHAAIRRFGPGTLLHVQQQTPEFLEGTFTKVKEGFFTGVLSHFVATGGGLGIAYAGWRDLCSQVTAGV